MNTFGRLLLPRSLLAISKHALMNENNVRGGTLGKSPNMLPFA
jgi:hypothetical protein